MRNFSPLSRLFQHLSIEGPDALDFGQRLFSRNLKNIQINEGLLSVLLNAEGRLQAVFWVIRNGGGLSLLVEEEAGRHFTDLLNKYHFSEHFEIRTMGRCVAQVKEDGNMKSGCGELQNEKFIGQFRGLTLNFDLRPNATVHALTDMSHGEYLRIRHRLPFYGLDYDEKTLIFDTDLDDFCDDDKGCYVGQEVVERVRSRVGHGPHRMATIRFEEAVSPNASLVSDQSKVVGQLTASQVNMDSAYWSLAVIKHSFQESVLYVGDSKISGSIVV